MDPGISDCKCPAVDADISHIVCEGPSAVSLSQCSIVDAKGTTLGKVKVSNRKTRAQKRGSQARAPWHACICMDATGALAEVATMQRHHGRPLNHRDGPQWEEPSGTSGVTSRVVRHRCVAHPWPRVTPGRGQHQETKRGRTHVHSCDVK